MEVSCQLHAPATLVLGGPQSRSGHCGEEKDLSCWERSSLCKILNFHLLHPSWVRMFSERFVFKHL